MMVHWIPSLVAQELLNLILLNGTTEVSPFSVNLTRAFMTTRNNVAATANISVKKENLLAIGSVSINVTKSIYSRLSTIKYFLHYTESKCKASQN